jgi:predicted PurR-regulated permease PerM
MPAKKNTIEISLFTLFNILFIAIAVAVLYYLRDIVMMVFVALILSSAINPWVDWLQRYKIPRTLSVFFIYLIAFSFIFISAYLLVGPVSFEISNLSEDFPGYWQKLSTGWQQLEVFSKSHGLESNIQNVLTSLQGNITLVAGNFFGSLVAFVGGIFSALVILVMTFYLTVYDGPMKRKIRSILTPKYQPYFTHTINRMQEKIGLWLRGQLLLSFIIFALCLGGLSVLGVKYAWVLALFAGVTEIIPYFGPFIGAVPAVFIAFSISPMLGLAVVVLYIVVQQLENYVIVPQVMKRAVGLNPVVIIIAMMVGARIAGIVGIVLAIPVTTAASVMLGDIFSKNGAGFSTADKKSED